ncbi:MAG: hypothetical protein ABSH08_00235 [Tepidisphaeraceae bacterium]|jgi:hypothetical protein
MKSNLTKKNNRTGLAKKDPNRYPKGLNRRKVQAIISHYENQTEDQAVAEDEAAYHSNAVTMMGVPVDLVPKVQQLIAKRS